MLTKNEKLLKEQERLKHVEDMLCAFRRNLAILGRVDASEEVKSNLRPQDALENKYLVKIVDPSTWLCIHTHKWRFTDLSLISTAILRYDGLRHP